MTLYRDHRGGFKESMATTRTLNNLQDLADHLGCAVEDLTVEPYPYWDYGTQHEAIKNTGQTVDRRNGWHTHIVCVRKRAVGWTDGPLNG